MTPRESTSADACGCPPCCSRARLDADRDGGMPSDRYQLVLNYLPLCMVGEFKRAALRGLLENHQEVLVRVDGTKCDVPEHLRAPGLLLRLGSGLAPPIEDLELRDDCWIATLRFSGKYYTCLVPWAAVEVVGAPGGPGFDWTTRGEKKEPEPEPVKKPALKLV